MHKYQLAIENYEFSDKVKSKSIMNIIKHYEGVIDDASNSTIYFGFPDELNQLWINRVAIGGFASNNYWSSTEINSAFVEVYYFGNGNSGTDQKDRTYAVRAIRAF